MLYGEGELSKLMSMIIQKMYIKHSILRMSGFHTNEECKWCIRIHKWKLYKEVVI